MVAGAAALLSLGYSTGWLRAWAPSAPALSIKARSLPKLMQFVASSLLSPTPACKDRWRGCPPLRKAPSSVCLGAPCSLGLDLQAIKVTPSGVPTTLVFVNCYQIGVPGLGPGGVPREPHYGHRMKQGGTLEVFSSSPFLPTPILANLDSLLGQKPGFLSGPPLPILEIGETVSCPTRFPVPLVWVSLRGTSAITSVSLFHLPRELENALYSGRRG